MVNNTFEQVLADEDGKKLIESIEHIGSNPEPRLVEIRNNHIKSLKEDFGYEYQ